MRLLFPPALSILICLPAYCQSVISVRSGIVNYFEGSAFIDDQPLEQKFGAFPSLKDGSKLRTERGRAEVLLTPGVFLRLDENSAVRMLSTTLNDTRVELLKGSAILDSLDATSDKFPSMIYKTASVRFSKKGLYRIDSDPVAVLHVYNGEAEVTQDNKPVTVDTSRLYFFTAGTAINKFGEDTDDDFSRWAEKRSDTIAAENQLSAQTARDPADVDNGQSIPTDPDVIIGMPPPYTGVPSITGIPGSFPLGGGIGNPYFAGLGLWGAFPVYPLYLGRFYRGSAYPRQPDRAHSSDKQQWPTGTSAEWWRRHNGENRWPHSTGVPGIGGMDWRARTGGAQSLPGMNVERWRMRTGSLPSPTGLRPFWGVRSGYPHSSTGTIGTLHPYALRPPNLGPRFTPRTGAPSPAFSRPAGVMAPRAAPTAPHAVGHR